MNVLLTGAFGRVGTAVIDHLADREAYEFTYLDREPHPDYDAHVADVSDFEAIRPAFDDQDAVVHLAGNPSPAASWGSVLENNVVGTRNALEAAKEAGVESFVFASTNHVTGMYEIENRPGIYDPPTESPPESQICIDHTDPVRPDSHYGVSKSFGEDLGRYYVECEDAPERFYALRICGVRHAADDHPYGDAERGVENGEFERRSEAYERAVAVQKARWGSRRDLAALVDAALQDETVTFDIFYGASDNRARWVDIEHARAVLGHRPRDDASEWDGPPE